MITVFTEAAKADLVSIGDYIAQDNPQRALSFVRDLRDVAARLADTPTAFALVPRYAKHGIRCRTFGRYLIFYRIVPEQLTILHIRHGARDYGGLLPNDA